MTLVATKPKKKPPAKKKKPAKAAKSAKRDPELIERRRIRPFRWLIRRTLQGGAIVVALCLALILLYSVVSPPTTPYIFSEARRLGGVDRQWVPVEEISPHMLRSVVAAEDANFCNHWGIDMKAIRAALRDGGRRGGSTISQQTVKNVFLWQDRSWLRKALEALITPGVEAVWTKRRILEVYLNVAEFDEGIFGVDAAAYHYFKTAPHKLSASQAAYLAAVLPNPKGRSASKPSARVRRKARQIQDGAATIRKDGRSACFEG